MIYILYQSLSSWYTVYIKQVHPSTPYIKPAFEHNMQTVLGYVPLLYPDKYYGQTPTIHINVFTLNALVA